MPPPQVITIATITKEANIQLLYHYQQIKPGAPLMQMLRAQYCVSCFNDDTFPVNYLGRNKVISYLFTFQTPKFCMIYLCNKSLQPLFYQNQSAWSMDKGSKRKSSAVHNLASTVTKFGDMWEGQALPHVTKFCNCRGKIVCSRMILVDPWSIDPTDLVW